MAFSQSSVMDDQVSFPIVKFSYATTAAGRSQPLGWSHVSSAGDLRAVFETASTAQGTQKVLRVVRETEILEELNLEWLVKEITSGSSQSSKPPIAVIVRLPCLAVRYPMYAEQIRRFQIKFSLSTDYYRAVAILSGLGCPITESTPVPVQNLQHPLQYTLAAPHVPIMEMNRNSEYYQAHLRTSFPQAPANTIGSQSMQALPQLQTTLDSPPQTAHNGSQVQPLVCNLPATTPISGQWQSPHSQNQQMMPMQPLNVSPPSALDCPPTAPPIPAVSASSLSQLLPPKRDLPFGKPQRKVGQQKPFANLTINRQQGSAELSARASPSPTRTKPRQDRGKTLQKVIEATNASNKGETGPQLPDTNAASATRTTPVATNLANGNISMEQQIPVDGEMEQNENINVPDVGYSAPITGEKDMLSQLSRDLSGYISTPSTDRAAIVESWVCQQLENEDFVALCQDVEGVWKRIAYGY